MWVKKQTSKQTMSTPLPIRRDCATQVADYLREKLKAGYWREHLPAERELARQLGVSRQSLRAALTEMQREGFIEERTRAGTRLSPRRQRRSTERPSVGVVFSNVIETSSIRSMLDEMKDFFESHQTRFEIHRVPYLKEGRVSAAFKKLLHETAHECWILAGSTAAMQKWCQQHGVPAMVFGIADKAGGLPCVGIDYQAVARHAVGEMLRRGHRRLALILPQSEKGEDIWSRLGFAAGVAQSPQLDATYVFEQHDLTIAGVCKLVDRLLAARPRPTAWLVCRQGHFITVLTHLLRQGVKVPGEISVICRNSDFYIGDLVPQPARYVYDWTACARQSARMALRIIARQPLPKKEVWIIPDFIEGATLGWHSGE